MAYIAKSAWYLVVHLVETGDIVLVLAGQTNSTMTPDLSLPTSGNRPDAGPWWSDATSWLCDDDNDVDNVLIF